MVMFLPQVCETFNILNHTQMADMLIRLMGWAHSVMESAFFRTVLHTVRNVRSEWHCELSASYTHT